MKKKKSFLVLASVLIVLLITYFGLHAWNTNQDRKEEQKSEAEKIYVTDLSDIAEIKYNLGNGDFHFIKEDNTWYYATDKDFPLAQNYPEQIALGLKQLTATRELEGGDSLQEYGLEKPTYTIQLTAGDGTKTSLYYGNVTGEEYYVTVDKKETVYTVSNTSITDMQYTIEEMAQLDAYPAITSGNLKKETITRSKETVTYDSENEEDSENIAAVAGGLGAVTLSEVADYSVEDKNLSELGLDEEKRITVQADYTVNEKDETLRLYIGNTDGNGNRYVRMNESKIVYLISEEICSNILNE